MKKSCRISLLFLLFFSFALFINAQKSNFKTNATIGVGTTVLDNSTGFYIGINPSYPLSSYISLEANISYVYNKINGTFLSGNTGFSNTGNALLGGRLYFMSNEKSNRLYINFLLGGFYSAEKIVGQQDDNFLSLGLSTGMYFEINKFLIGISVETPQNLFLKAGYIF